MRTVPDVDLFQPLEEAIRNQFLPALTGRLALSDVERELIALQARLEGLGISIPTRSANRQQASCAQVTGPLVKLINSNAMDYPRGVLQEQKEMKAKVQSRNREKAAEEGSLTKGQQNTVEQASVRGAATWLTAIPMTKYGFKLNKQAFRDALCLRYGWTPERLLSLCPCWQVFSVAHAFSCPKGALPSIRHNHVRDIMAQLLTKVCSNVGIEPTLQPLSGESFPLRSTNVEEGARLDIKAQNFRDNSKRSAYFDVHVFNAHASTNSNASMKACYRRRPLLHWFC